MGQFDGSGNYVVDDSDYAGYTPPGGYGSQKRSRFGSFLNSFMRPQQDQYSGQQQYGGQAGAQMVRRPGILQGLAGQSGAGGVLGSIGKVARIFI